jgi:DNA repair exonuclease SbcCD ATPase subunit
MTGDLAHLSDRPRDENMKKMRPLGIWERQMLNQGKDERMTTATILPIASAAVKMTVKNKTSQGDGKKMSNHGRDEIEEVRPVPTKKEETKMDTTGKDGTCGLCDKKGRTKLIEGKFCCATCEAIRRNCKKRPEVMLEQLREFHPDLLSNSSPSGDSLPGMVKMEISELAEANINLVSHARKLEEEKNQLQALADERLVEINKLGEIRTGLLEEINSLKTRLDYVKNTTVADDDQAEGSADEVLNLRGELEGLQDVLNSLEEERSAMRQERVRLTDQVRWLHEQLSATERKADGLEKEIDRLQEAKVVPVDSAANHPACILGSSDDPVNHPRHYTSHPSGIECIQITEHMSFTLGNAVKYVWRADLKDDSIKDLRKAQWYISREIAKREAAAMDIENPYQALAQDYADISYNQAAA